MTIDHDMTPDPVCPWCGEEYDDIDAANDGAVGDAFHCQTCGGQFTVDVHTTYSTEKVETDDEQDS